ncbi:DUF2293 domain-containing protein [Mariniblastus fucicola]|nr:DUF2293 domain-containing protein [Mariniblastus fucicola]
MPTETRIVSPGPKPFTVRTDDGKVLNVPKNWELLPPGDAGVTRRVKSRGPSWTMKEKKGRRVFSLGVWALKERIAEVKAEFEAERSTDAYAKKQASAAKRREKKQAEYVEDFTAAILKFLDFDDRYSTLAAQLANAVSEHATPVGSGTVARTQRIPIERRAASAVIAWMRHQTTAYDHMSIPRVKGKRREVRRMLAEESKAVLRKYRTGEIVDFEKCPLARAVADTGSPRG